MVALHSKAIEEQGEQGWAALKKALPEEKREMLQAFHADPKLGGARRGAMERLLREELRKQKEAKKRPKGDFVKLLITHRGWNAAKVRQILRDPAVCREHPEPAAAEQIWVCERNIPPIGSWLLNYTKLEDEELSEEKRKTMEAWDNEYASKAESEQPIDPKCACRKWMANPGASDYWKGHICTADVHKFQSPFLRALLRKGHAFKYEMAEETLVKEVAKGLDGYIQYKCKHAGDPSLYEKWRQAILTRIKVELKKGDITLYPNSRAGAKDVEELQRDLVFLKEDRAPHVAVAMCKHRYMLEREKYLTSGSTFQVATETEEDIINRHTQYHNEKGLLPNSRLPYIYGIWKSAKRGLRWISGARKQEGETGNEPEKRPKASIAGAGTELVPLLQKVMHSLVSKDEDGRRKGRPKRCWFVESVDEVAQAVRFDAIKVAEHGATANTVDFVTMYPNFDQQLLKARVAEAVREAWEWEEAKQGDMGEGTLYLSKDGWISGEGVQKEGEWKRDEVLDMIAFVVDNGYVKRGGKIYKQVQGFGMGLACAPQLANLGCYVVERDFAEGRQPEEVEHTYRFIDDILTMSGCIPSEEAYGMKYKTTRQRLGHLVYLGMEMDWYTTTNGVAFSTGMHFRDATYPIEIRRYPANGSMVTDAQRIGVVTGQFIRAQRICSTLGRFKLGVQDVVLAALRRGYKKNELDRVWGKFLAQWWKAQEVRRGELRAWFRRMVRAVQWRVWEQPEELGSSRQCRFKEHCRYKADYCPFIHPVIVAEKGEPRGMDVDPPPAEVAERAVREAEAAQGSKAEQGGVLQVSEATSREIIPKTEATVWKAIGDGSCLFYCMVGENDRAKAQALRLQVAQFAGSKLDDRLGACPVVLREALGQRGLSPEGFCHAVVEPGTYGGEIELFLTAHMQERQFKIFQDMGDIWGEVAHIGAHGSLTRLLFTPRAEGIRPHYDMLHIKERWEVQMAQQAVEEQRRRQTAKESDRTSVKNTEKELRERAEARAKQYLDRSKEGRKNRTQESRDKPTEDLDAPNEEVAEEEGQGTLETLLAVGNPKRQCYCVCQRPYSTKEYYIQCSVCKEWFHPKCLGLTRAECEAQRQAESWQCRRPDCGQGSAVDAEDPGMEQPPDTTGEDTREEDEEERTTSAP